ncbi:MAG: hypothetical protein K0U54_05080 [Bacteroidetes bacterium]|nr:hypothetical protein [Bacteroidota bacterium]
MKNILTLLCLLLISASCKDAVKELKDDANNDGKRDWIPEPDANPELTTAEVIAYKNGFDHWKKVNTIGFTFNVDRPNRHFERSFIWHPKTDDVVYMSGTDTITYNRKATLDSIQLNADQAFINDKYWLLAPYQLVWDEGTTFSEKENQIAPISKDTLTMLTMVYDDEGGYTPGDAYDFYFGKDFVIKEWIFREGNQETPSMINTFEDYEEIHGLKIAKTHRDSTGTFKLHFTNISVE